MILDLVAEAGNPVNQHPKFTPYRHPILTPWRGKSALGLPGAGRGCRG
ncbi:hypothetical protein HFN09_08770 [Rhizobium leguminosarum]|nr:hypothetical protein [Rhizobium leguminosarum]